MGQAGMRSEAGRRSRQQKLARQKKKQRMPSSAVLGGGGAVAVLVVLVLVALLAHLGPFGSGHKTNAGASVPLATAGDPSQASPGTRSATDPPTSARKHPGRTSSKHDAKPSPSAKTSPSGTPSTTAAKPPAKHGSGALVPFGSSLLVDGGFTQTTLEPWNYVVDNATIEPGAGVGGQNAVQLMSTPDAAVGQTVSGLTPGASYEVSGWAYTNDGTKIYIGAMDTVDNTINDHDGTTAGSWTELSAVFKVPPDQSSATIYCIMESGGTGYCSGLSFRAMHHS
jgi:Carbohydrate binding domain